MRVCDKVWEIMRGNYKMEIDEKDIRRFWSKVNVLEINDCWEWIGVSHSKGGYGKFKCKRKTVISSRIAYQLYNGEIPKGMLICHTCDNPSCCNPHHLFSGTTKDNIRDASLKGHLKEVGGNKRIKNVKTGEIYFSVRDTMRKLNITKNEFYKIIQTEFNLVYYME